MIVGTGRRTKATALEKLEVQFAAEYRRHLQTERGDFLCKVANKSRSWKIRFPAMLSSVVFWGLIALIGTSRGSYPFTHSMNPHLHPRLYHGCYGDIMTMKTSGATCDANSVMNCGIRGSEMFAEMDLRAIKPYQTLIKEVGQRHCVDPAVIAAIISRESHGGSVLQDGWDHRGLKFGLMQLPILKLSARNTDVPGFPVETVLTLCFISGGLSAFKSGVEAIATPVDIDNDFVNDIIARAKFYKRQSF
nr:lysozyme g-like protein 2 [Macaca nemestrina]